MTDTGFTSRGKAAAWVGGTVTPLRCIFPLLRPGKCSPCQLAGYFGSSRSRAALVGSSGRNVSHITASSCVCVAVRLASIVPGCGPCGIPCGWAVRLPISMPLRLPKFPST